jgi:uncharacterized membrane protein
MLASYAADWLDLLVRWLHVIAGIAWIGTSFYFIALDHHLEAPERPDDTARGVGGESWEIHGGGFYRIEKFRVAPPRLPERLHWFKWEAYTTWLSGFALLAVVYYVDTRAYLIDPRVADLAVAAAVAISVALLVVAWIAYDALCRAVRGTRALAALLAGLVVLASWGTSELFTPRAAYVHVGAMLGTIMAANVFFVIIPAQRELVRAMLEGREPDATLGARAKQRSVHNNYLTLPVVFAMLSNHFPLAYGHDDGWLVLVALTAVGAWVRHFFNLRHRGRNAWWILASGAAAIALLAVWVAPRDEPAGAGAPPSPEATGDGRALFTSAGCGTCHALADAGAAGTIGPSLDESQPSREFVIDRVTNGQGAMPAFAGRLSPDEIEAIAGYVARAAAP